MTATDLQQAERAYETAVERAALRRANRDALIRRAIAEGWTHAQISDATGLTRGRIGQIALSAERA